MIHLLMGYSCETLGVYPFTPVDISLTHTTSRELLGTQEQDFDIMICPGVSTYVGGDITAGMYALDLDKERSRACWWISALTARWRSDVKTVSW